MTHGGAAWPVILLLGVWHGINPAMGWLFAVALGLQERSARAVWRALPPLAAGHALAVAAAVSLAAAAGMVLEPEVLKRVVALLLLGAGAWRLRGHGHGRYRGMQVGVGALAVWSSGMASAHGAGLMVVPFVLRGAAHDVPSEPAGHGAHLAAASLGMPEALTATAIHSAAYLLTTGLIALLVYRWIGLRFLRTLWVNLDLVWALALIATGAATLLV